MGDSFERSDNGCSVNNDQVIASFKTLSLKESERTNNVLGSNIESRGLAYSSNSSFFGSNDKSTCLIPQQNNEFVDEENINASQNKYYLLENSSFSHNDSKVPTLVSHSSGARFSPPNDVANSNCFENQYSRTRNNSIASLAMTSQGSRYLQLLLHKGQINTMDLLKAMYESLVDVMTDRYGYHVFRRIIDDLDQYELATIIFKIKAILVDIACSEYGSYSVQKLITLVRNVPVLPRVITSTLSMDYFQLMTSRKGRHTVEHCLTILCPSDLEVLYEATISNWLTLAKDPQGCISLNSLIDSIPPPYRVRLLFAITENSASLSFDPSGTFVLQHVLELCNEVINNEICYKLCGNFVRLSHIQHGSHLVQKCIQLSLHGIIYFVKELIEGKDELKSLVQDQFGNYVIQTALEVSKEKNLKIHFFLKNRLQQLEPLIGKSKYALHVFMALNGFPKF